MEITTDELRKIAEHIGLPLMESSDGKTRYEVKAKNGIGWHHIIFNPETNLEQLEMIIDWCIKSGFDIAIQFEQGTKKWGCEIFTTENYYSEFGTNKSTAFLKSFSQLIETN